MNTDELIEKAVSLPVEQRALVIDSLLSSLNRPEKEIDDAWVVEANRRLSELRSGSVKAVPGQQAFDTIWQRFDRSHAPAW